MCVLLTMKIDCKEHDHIMSYVIDKLYVFEKTYSLIGDRLRELVFMRYLMKHKKIHLLLHELLYFLFIRKILFHCGIYACDYDWLNTLDINCKFSKNDYQYKQLLWQPT